MPTIEFEPTVFIFLGSSAGQVGWRLKEMIDSSFGEFPLIRYFWVDTDTNIDPEAARWLNSSQVDRVELAGFNADNLLTNLDRWPTIKAWWPHESGLKPGLINRGAHQIRAVGRLALFRLFNDSQVNSTGPLYGKLSQALNQIMQIANLQAAAQMGNQKVSYRVNPTRVRVILVFSNCGGTGSSLAFDVAQLCRSILTGTAYQVSAVVMLPPVIQTAMRGMTQDQQNKLKANSYAWLLENEELIRCNDWNVEYPGGIKVHQQLPPFDTTLLIDIANSRNLRLNSEEDIFKMLALALFMNTGNAIGGQADSFADNIGITARSDPRTGRIRSYSSLAATCMVYPKERIGQYCSARLGKEIISQQLLATPEERQLKDIVTGLISQLGLNRETLVVNLLAGCQIDDDFVEAARNQESPSKALEQLARQEEADNESLDTEENSINSKALLTLTEQKNQLETRLINIMPSCGVLVIQKALELFKSGTTLLSTPNKKESIEISIENAINKERKKIEELGVNDRKIGEVQTASKDAKEQLKELGDDFGDAVHKFLLRNNWEEAVTTQVNDCLEKRNQYNQLVLRRAAETAAIRIYNDLSEVIDGLIAKLTDIAQIFRLTQNRLSQDENKYLEGHNTDQYFELAHEVVGADYFTWFYEKYHLDIHPQAVLQHFFEIQEAHVLEEFQHWTDEHLTSELEQCLKAYFDPNLENISLLEALDDFYGSAAAQRIQTVFDDLVTYCSPFWRCNTNLGFAPQGPSVVGVENPNDPLIPGKVSQNPNFQLKPTAAKDMIYMLTIAMGMPAFALTEIENWKSMYNLFRQTSPDPLQVLPGMDQADGVIPEETKNEAREAFAKAVAFGYITLRGSNQYYYDPEQIYQDHKVHPNRDHQLAAGRRQAEEAFIGHVDWVAFVDNIVENFIDQKGLEVTIQLLDSKIGELKTKINAGVTADLQKQLMNELNALNRFREKLASGA